MEIFALKGHKVKVTANPDGTIKNGDSSDKKKIEEHLEVGKIYTVEYTNVHSWNTDVVLEGFPGVVFNSVNFESVTDQPVELSKGHPDWNRFN